MAIIYGVLRQVPMKGKLISYQAPTYFGMLCAAYMPS
jgi:aromatic ring-opening dioxygenase LigB subunit